MTPLQELVAALGATRPRRPAVGLRGAFGARWWTYAELGERARAVAGRLRGDDVGPGAHVVLWAPNGPEWVAAVLGCWLRGVVVVPVDPGASAAAVGRIVDIVAPVRVIVGDDVDAAALGVTALGVTAVPLAALVDDGGDPPPPGAVAARDAAAAVVLFTSGTTGAPRGVTLSHANLASQLAALRRWRPFTTALTCRLLALSPLSHAQGLLMGMLVPLSLRVSVLYGASVAPTDVAEAIRAHRVHVVLAVPRVQHLLADLLRHAPSGRRGTPVAERVATIRWFPVRRHLLYRATRRLLGHRFWGVLVGGASLAPRDERFWYEAGYVLVHGYGLTETSALVSYTVNGPFFARLGSVGAALPGQQVRLGPDGEILVRGPNVAAGVGDGGPVLTGDGFLRTGDLARRGPRGRLYFRGRHADRIVTSEGENVRADEVEDVLRSLPGVRDAVVADVPRDDASQVHAVLLLAPDAAADDVVRRANRQLEVPQRIRAWSTWAGPDFPRTSLLKVRRAEVIAHVTGSVAGASSAPPPLPDLAAIAAEGDPRRRLALLARYALEGPPDRAAAAPLVATFGLSSLDAVELLTLVEQGCGRPLPPTGISAETTLHDVQVLARGDPPRGDPRTRAAPLPTRQPAWSASVVGCALRRVTQPAVIGTWRRVAVDLRITTPRPEPPVVLAVAPHRHWLDGFAVRAALPRDWRTLTVTNRDFAEAFGPHPSPSWRTRTTIRLTYHLLWPLVFAFVIVPNRGSTRQGLRELGRWIDRGYSPITFPKGLAPPGEPNPRHDPGVALIAAETGLPVVPVWLTGTDELGVGLRRRQRVDVAFGRPIRPDPEGDPAALAAAVEAGFAELAAVAAR